MTRPTDLEALVAGLSVRQQAALTAGVDMWTVPAVGQIPAIRMTDGPNGARGAALLGTGRVTALCVPCGSSLGATWDPGLVEEIGQVLGEEARTKGARVLLAPTINLHRHPLGGRGFECYAEDPLLSGAIAAGFVRGVQSRGVAATAKHLVANEAEFERTTLSSVVSERALRELYLVPFEAAIREGGLLAVMTAYNRVNGRWCSEDRALLIDWLREEIGFTGVVMTDWYAAGSTCASALAGLGLQMPGGDRFFGAPLAAAVESGELSADVLAGAARRWVGLVDALDAWDDAPVAEQSVELPAHREVARRAAAAGTVLLRNDGALPLTGSGSVALIGPLAARAHLMGGGSAQLKPHRSPSLYDILAPRYGDRLVHERGCDIDRTVRPLTVSGELELFAGQVWAGPPVERLAQIDLQQLWFGSPNPDLDEDDFSFRTTATLRVHDTGTHTFTLVQAGRARVLVDGAIVLDGITKPPPGGQEFFGLGSQELRAQVDLVAGAEVTVVVEWTSIGSVMLHGAKVGHQPPSDGGEIQRAGAAARAADVAVVVVGTTEEWESEGHDRDTLALPGEQDDLVRAVAAANPRTIVIVCAGAPVALPWAGDVAAVLLPWLGGQEVAHALDDILHGLAEPAGRLPVTFPQRLEHTPAFGSYPGENDEVVYAEDLLVGYRWYDTRHLPVAFPFGHGGSYTTFAWGAGSLSQQAFSPGDALLVRVEVNNTGESAGSEVVQVYIRPHGPRLLRPRSELKGFAKVHLEAGESRTVEVVLTDRSFACWDPGSPDRERLRAELGDGSVVPAVQGPPPRSVPGWSVDPGRYDVVLARSVADEVEVLSVVVLGAEAGSPA